MNYSTKGINRIIKVSYYWRKILCKSFARPLLFKITSLLSVKPFAGLTYKEHMNGGLHFTGGLPTNENKSLKVFTAKYITQRVRIFKGKKEG